MFFEVFQTVITGTISILNLPLTFGQYHLTLWIIMLGSAVIGIVARLIWGLFE